MLRHHPAPCHRTVAGGAPGTSGLPLRLLREMRLRSAAGQALMLAPLPEYLPPQARPQGAQLLSYAGDLRMVVGCV